MGLYFKRVYKFSLTASVLSPLFSTLYTDIGKEETDSVSNLIADQTAVNVKAVSGETFVPVPKGVE